MLTGLLRCIVHALPQSLSTLSQSAAAHSTRSMPSTAQTAVKTAMAMGRMLQRWLAVSGLLVPGS